jgi:hypothetical protein
MEKFTKGKMKAHKPASSNGFWYLDLKSKNNNHGGVATLYSENAENDAKLFSVAGEMYEELRLLLKSGNLSESKSNKIGRILAKARGEK